MRRLNLGVLAHVDAGKTSLTERLLYAAGVIDTLGGVDTGDTQTDSLEQERRRGITIKSAVASFAIGDIAVNLIDTPGHPDFIAEVERVLAVLDGAVLVISAVEGVQAQTRVLMRALQRLAIPTLIFVNKIDRRGADPEAVLAAIRERLTREVLPMGAVLRAGERTAEATLFGPDDAPFHAGLTETLAEHDDGLLAEYLAGAPISYRRLRRQLTARTRRAQAHPLFFGSAITGAGVGALRAGIAELLPARLGTGQGPTSGVVFKVERGASGEKIAYVRMFSGEVRVRDRLEIRGVEHTVTDIGVFDAGAVAKRPAVEVGEIGKLWGLSDVRIGDSIGAPRPAAGERHFGPPTLETVIAPARGADRGRLYAALAQLAEQDPLINLRQDDLRQELSLSLYGEVQKQVIADTLAADFGVAVEFRETTTLCIERVIGVGAAVDAIKVGDNPFLATVGLRVEAAPLGSGVTFALEVEFGSIPHAFHRAVEETVFKTLAQGIKGWPVTDCVVTMTHSGYWPRQSHSHATFDKSMSSTAGDFRNLTPLVLMAALKRAGTVVCEPMHRFDLELPADLLAQLLPVLARLDAVPGAPEAKGAAYRLTGEIPAARVHELAQKLPGLTRGEGVLETASDHYRPVRGAPPSRTRTDLNPLDRREYLLRMQHGDLAQTGDAR